MVTVGMAAGGAGRSIMMTRRPRSRAAVSLAVVMGPPLSLVTRVSRRWARIRARSFSTV